MLSSAEPTVPLAKVLRKKKVLIVCAFCWGPITLVQKVWTHLANTLEVYHVPMPPPEGKKTANVNYASRIATSLSDFVKTLKREVEWVGPYVITDKDDDFILQVSILAEDADRVQALALQQGLYAGKTARATRAPAKDESAEEGGDDMPGKKKVAKKAKAAGTSKQRSKEDYRQDPNYRECKHCGHFVLKAKWDKHLEKHPECKDQTPKTVAKKTTKATKKTTAKKTTAKKG